MSSSKRPLSYDGSLDSDSSDGGAVHDGTSGLPRSDPLDALRRSSVGVQLLGAGVACIGSDVLIALYVTGIPDWNDLGSASTSILVVTFALEFLAAVPSWLGFLVVVFGGKAKANEPPPHARLLRWAAFLAFLFATMYAIAGLVLWVLLKDRASFVTFCLQNVITTEEKCAARWDRVWIILLAVGMVLALHISVGFPVYRFTRGGQFGSQLEAGRAFLPELGKSEGSRSDGGRRRASSFWKRSSAGSSRSGSRRREVERDGRGTTALLELEKPKSKPDRGKVDKGRRWSPKNGEGEERDASGVEERRTRKGGERGYAQAMDSSGGSSSDGVDGQEREKEAAAGQLRKLGAVASNRGGNATSSAATVVPYQPTPRE